MRHCSSCGEPGRRRDICPKCNERPHKEGSLVKATPIKATPIKATPIKATPIKATPIKATPIKATPILSTAEQWARSTLAEIESTNDLEKRVRILMRVAPMTLAERLALAGEL